MYNHVAWLGNDISDCNGCHTRFGVERFSNNAFSIGTYLSYHWVDYSTSQTTNISSHHHLAYCNASRIVHFYCIFLLFMQSSYRTKYTLFSVFSYAFLRLQPLLLRNDELLNTYITLYQPYATTCILHTFLHTNYQAPFLDTSFIIRDYWKRRSSESEKKTRTHSALSMCLAVVSIIIQSQKR